MYFCYTIFYLCSFKYLDSNCLNVSEFRYKSPYVYKYGSNFNSRCPTNMCSNSLRSDGCLFCDTGDNNATICTTCLMDHILFNGTCVQCVGWESCEFNNSNSLNCTDGNPNISLCDEYDDARKCVDNKCVYGECGDGKVTGNEECDSSKYCDNSTCKCAFGCDFNPERKSCDPIPGGDTMAFRDTLSSLCSLNTVGRFASCCGRYEMRSVTLDPSEARNCFVPSITYTSGSLLTSLFVLLFVLFAILRSNRSLEGRELSVLGSGVFSNLTNLMSLLYSRLFHVFVFSGFKP